MRNKKSRKSLFTWCIRTLAVSLVPSLLLVSCASDSSDSATPDTTAPTASFGAPDTTVVGTVAYTLTFSEAVTGVSSSISLVEDSSSTALLPVTATPNTSSTVWTIDPDGVLSTGSYTLTLTSSGIKDSAGNVLDNVTPLKFNVADAHSTLLNELQVDLTNAVGAGLVTSIVSAVTSATTSYSGAGNGNNTFNNIVPVALGAAFDAIEADTSLTDNQEATAYEAVFNSVMSTVTTANLNSPSARSAAAVDSGYTSLFGDIGTIIGNKVSSVAAMEKILSAFVQSLIKAGVTSGDVGSYVGTIAEKATTTLVNRCSRSS